MAPLSSRVCCLMFLVALVDPSEVAPSGLFRLEDGGHILRVCVSGQWSNPIWAFLAVAAWEQSAWLKGLSGLEQPDRSQWSECTALGDGQQQGKVPPLLQLLSTVERGDHMETNRGDTYLRTPLGSVQ